MGKEDGGSGLSIRQMGVLLSEDEVLFISHLLISLKADDLVLEEARCDALAWITRVQQDIADAKTGPAAVFGLARCADVASWKWPAGNPTLPATLLWRTHGSLLSAPSAPLSQRKFVWDRTFGQFGAGDVGVDLLAPFRGQPGATHLGATVMRIRGYIVPSEVFDVTGGAGVCVSGSIRGTRTSPTSTTSPSCSPTTTGWPGSPWCHRTYCPSHQRGSSETRPVLESVPTSTT